MGILDYPRWIVGLLVMMITSLEVILPNQYVVGYAYAVPILFATYRINGYWAKWVTAIGICMTLLSCLSSKAHVL